MQAQKNLVEQQLQETAGDLVQAERELSRSGVRSPGSETSRSLRKLGTSVSMVDDLEKELSKYKAEFDSVMSVRCPDLSYNIRVITYHRLGY
jgi:hypothetical protein